ncbi:MAG: hypothetical protein VX252_06065 [Myxococcota bacterium]|nr:hypothetical protein [Myxococcota bacterium]
MGRRRMASGRSRAGAVLMIFSLFVGCASWSPGNWGKQAQYVGFNPDSVNRGGAADFTILVPLSKIFYERVTARRFNSLATYEDPALREFFRSQEAFSDYYAALAEALVRANFEYNRPTAVRLEAMTRVGPNRVDIRVYFRGENAKPLRFWTTHLIRTDRWEFSAGRWWVVPGKV